VSKASPLRSCSIFRCNLDKDKEKSLCIDNMIYTLFMFLGFRLENTVLIILQRYPTCFSMDKSPEVTNPNRKADKIKSALPEINLIIGMKNSCKSLIGLKTMINYCFLNWRGKLYDLHKLSKSWNTLAKEYTIVWSMGACNLTLNEKHKWNIIHKWPADDIPAAE
jgi:hypothetical protein